MALPVFVVLTLVLNQASDDAPPDAGDSAATVTSLPPELPPLDVETPPVSAEADAVCPGLMGGLPLLLDGLRQRPVRSATAYAAAWGDPPVVLRCAVPRPAALTDTSELAVINGITWFPLRGAATTVWTSLDRAVYVEVSAPSEAAAAPVALLAEVITERVPPLAGPGATPSLTPSGTPTPTR